jgi:hypothetical protein
MATFKSIGDARRITKSTLNQLIDFVEEDISGSATRKKFQVFVTGGVGPGVTSSIFHTVFDQDHSLQTSNEIFDVTFGIFSGSGIVATSSSGIDQNGKLLFPSESLMMREKVNVYSQFAQLLLGDATSQFTSPFSAPSATGTDNIDSALFLTFKRLFVRDGIKRETFAMRFYQSASAHNTDEDAQVDASIGQQNLYRATTSGSVIFTDVGSATSAEGSQTGGAVGNLLNSSNTNENVGLVFYDAGVVVLDLAKVTSASQAVSGAIKAVGNTAGEVVIGRSNPGAKFIPDFIVSASMDDVIEHISSVRFQSGSKTFLTFQNNTTINSSIYFCRAEADEFNFSTNPSYTDSDGRIRVIDKGQENIQKAFSFITTVGLYDARENLIAVAKLSRPIEKNDEKDLTFRVRLDF